MKDLGRSNGELWIETCYHIQSICDCMNMTTQARFLIDPTDYRVLSYASDRVIEKCTVFYESHQDELTDTSVGIELQEKLTRLKDTRERVEKQARDKGHNFWSL